MSKPVFIVRRYPYEEPYHLQIELMVSNGTFTCAGDIYVGRDELAEIGQGLGAFPSSVPDEYVYEYVDEEGNAVDVTQDEYEYANNNEDNGEDNGDERDAFDVPEERGQQHPHHQYGNILTPTAAATAPQGHPNEYYSSLYRGPFKAGSGKGVGI